MRNNKSIYHKLNSQVLFVMIFRFNIIYLLPFQEVLGWSSIDLLIKQFWLEGVVKEKGGRK